MMPCSGGIVRATGFGGFHMRHVLAAAAVLIGFSAGSAFATGNLGCAIDDATMDLNIESVITHGLGEPIVSLRGELKLKDRAASDLFGVTEFDGTHVAQYWLEGTDLRLLVYRDLDAKTAHGSAELTIKTQAIDDEGGFEGRYRLSVFYKLDGDAGDGHTIERDGKIGCFAG